MRDTDPTDIGAHDQARELQERNARVAREQDLADFVWVMKDRRGRRFVWRLLTLARVFTTTFRAHSSKEQDFAEGMRSIGLVLLADAHATCLTLYHQMEREHATHAQRHPTR